MQKEKIKEILSKCDHTLLSPDATLSEIYAVCDDAIKYNTASVCIPPSYVREAKNYTKGMIPICTVIGFPCGYQTTDVKCFECRDAVSNGADEIDMVINIGKVKDGDYDFVEKEISAVRAQCTGKILKVIIETCLLSNEEIVKLCSVVQRAGADYIKTSTGFSKQGATFDAVKLMVDNVSGKLKVKAAGGISSLEDAKKFIVLGASRLGTSRVVKEVKKLKN
ncbi:MAG: deoxyribose-phosphate aldolase [Eubacteriales bacterium]|nr:deoxyribose-phosphate aldolase [Eubacteriales bacterium]